MRGKAKWSIFVTLILALSMLLSACSGGNTSNQSSNKKTDQSKNSTTQTGSSSGLAADQVLNINITSEPPSLNPGVATDSTSMAVLEQTFEGLTRIDKDGKAKKAIASDIKKSADGKTYTFTIRDGAKWSNGDPVTAQDFVYAWQWVLNPKNANTDYAYQLYSIKNAQKAKKGDVSLDQIGVKAVDAHTLQVTLEQPTPYFLQLTAFPTYYPVDKKVVENNPKWAQNASANYVSDGPFVLSTWDHKNKIVLKKNDKYWDASNVKLNQINMDMINDANTELQQYKTGKYDWAGAPTGNLPLSAIPALKKSGDLNIKPIAGVYYYAFNVNKKPFNNANIRKAFALAINRQAIVDNITKGGQLPAMALVPPSMFPDNKTGYFKDNDVAKAKEYLKKGLTELGYSSVKDLPTVTLSYNTSQAHAIIAQAIQDMWKKTLGVNVSLSNAEWKVYLQNMTKGDFQVGRMGWLGDFNDPINFLDIFYAKGGNNYTNWSNKQYASLLDKSRTETDPAQRQATMKKAEKLFMDNMPIAPIYFYTDAYLKKPYVKGVVVSGLGNVQYKWAYIAKH